MFNYKDYAWRTKSGMGICSQVSMHKWVKGNDTVCGRRKDKNDGHLKNIAQTDSCYIYTIYKVGESQ